MTTSSGTKATPVIGVVAVGPLEPDRAAEFPLGALEAVAELDFATPRGICRCAGSQDALGVVNLIA